MKPTFLQETRQMFALKYEINKTDKEIDWIVYVLTEEDKRIVERV